MKHTLRCMKNEVGFAYEACLRHTERGSVLRFIDVADVCFMATKLTLHIRQGECFILFAVLFTLWEFYVIILYVVGSGTESRWMILGLAGGLIFGVGLFNFTAIIIKQYLGHLVSVISFVAGGLMMLISWFLCR